MPKPTVELIEGDGPLIATAIHDGHELRPELQAALRLSDAERLREEDPFTSRFTRIARTSLVVKSSRFQVDLNRPRDQCVYLTPEQAWGLELWKTPPERALLALAAEEYDRFYALLEDLCAEKARRFGRFVLFDLHSYNHRRAGPDAPPEPPAENPEINLGTGSVPGGRSREPIERFLAVLRGRKVRGRPLDARENVKFQGGHLAHWVHERFPAAGLALAIEVKKFFMDEWTGVPDEGVLSEIGGALAEAAAAVEKVSVT
jgi:N-formylglutamate deformylase